VDLALQVVGFSDETVKYMVTGLARLGPVNDCTANYRPVLSSERVPHFNNQAIVRLKKRKEKSSHVPQRSVRYQDGLVVISATMTTRVALVRSEKLVAEEGGSSGTQRKGNVRSWKPLASNELVKTEKTLNVLYLSLECVTQ
jgi:hypothetical protein